MKKNNRPATKYFIYARKSSESEERQSRSIEDQLSLLWKTAHQSQFNVIAEFTESKTARNPGRPMFDEMLERIESGEADGILAWHPDRLARNAVDGGRIMYLLDTGQLKNLSFENFWFENTSQGKYMLYLAFAQSKYYTDNLSENIHRGIKAKLAKGIYPNWAKRGYINHPKTREIIPDPERFHLIKDIFEMYASGNYSFHLLGQHVFEKGFKNRSGGTLSASQVQRMLKDPFYYSAFRFKDELYQGCHKPAISKELFDKAQLVMRNKGRKKTINKHNYAFTGMMVCDECGHAITAEKQKGYVYYRCTKRSKTHDCKQPYIREDKLINEFDKMFDQITLPDSWYEPILLEIEKLSNSHESDTSKLLSDFESKFSKIQSRISRLADLYIEGEMDRADYIARKDLLLNEKIALLERRRSISEDTSEMRFERMRRPLMLVQDWKNGVAGDDPENLRKLIAEVGSNFKLSSRKLLWNWINPCSLLANTASYTTWRRGWDSNPRYVAVHTLSRRAPSATRSPLHIFGSKICPERA